MNVYTVSRRSVAAILTTAALTLGACSDSGDTAADETTTEQTSERPSPTSETTSTFQKTSTAEESESADDSERSEAGDVAKIDAEDISFTLDGVEMTCWVGQEAFLNCQGTAEWTPMSGNGPANSLSFDMNAGAIQAMHANANMADWDVEEVGGGGRYEAKGVIFDPTESDRMAFTDELSGKSGVHHSEPLRLELI